MKPRASGRRKLVVPVGNAGIFSTASDLARFAALWQHDGAYENHRFCIPMMCGAALKMSFPKAKKILFSVAAGAGKSTRTTSTANTRHPAQRGTPVSPALRCGCIAIGASLHRAKNRVYPTRNGPNRMPFHRAFQMRCWLIVDEIVGRGSLTRHKLL